MKSMVIIKLSIICLTGLLLVFVSGCGTGGSGSQNVTSVATYGVTINSNLLQNGQTYTVSVFSDYNDSLAYANCTASNGVCMTNIPQADFIIGNVNVKVTNQNKSLVAAGEVDSSYYLLNTSSPIIELDEQTTGSYIMSELQIIADGAFPDVDVEETLDNVLNIDSSEPGIDLINSVAAYTLFSQLQGAFSETDGFYKTFYYLYGTASDSNSTTISQSGTAISSQTSIVSGMVNSMSPALKTAVTNTFVLNQAGVINNFQKNTFNNININASPEAQKEVKQTDYSKGVDASGITSVATNMAKKLGVQQIPTNSEDVQTWTIAKDLVGATLKLVDIAIPGLGTVLNSLSNGIFAAAIGTPPDPNKPILDALNMVNDSVKAISTDLNSMQFVNLTIKLANSEDTTSNSIIAINTFTQSYFTILTRAGGATYQRNDDSIYAQLLDRDLNATNSSNGSLSDKVKVLLAMYDDNKKVNNIADLPTFIQFLTSDTNIAKIGAIAQSTLDQGITNIRQNINSSPANFSPSSDKNFINQYKNTILSYTRFYTSVMAALEKSRQFYLGAAYLKYKSDYNSSFTSINVGSIPNFASGSYTSSAKAVNDYFTGIEKNFSDNMSQKISDLSQKLIDNNAKTWFDSNLTQFDKNTNKSTCYVTYWDSKNLGYMCDFNSTRKMRYFIGDIANSCKLSNGTTTHISKFGTDRYACATPLNAKWQLSTDDVSGSFKNFVKYWVNDWSNGYKMNGSRVVFYPTGLFAINSRAQTISNVYTPYTSVWKSMIQIMTNAYSDAYINATTLTPYFNLDATKYDLVANSYFQMDVNGSNNIYNVTILTAYSGPGIFSGNPEFYSTLGCNTSDCLIEQQSPNGVVIRFDNGQRYTLQKPTDANIQSYILKSNAKASFQIDGAQASPFDNWKPSGYWTSKCSNILISGKWITALCDAKTAGASAAWSSLNFGSCSTSGAQVTVNSQNMLQCL